MKVSVCLAVASATTAWAAAVVERQTNWTVGQTVQTSSGPVSGHGYANHTDVSEYLGIPYGKAERFGVSQRFNGTAPLPGSAFGPSCPVKAGQDTPPTAEQIAKANVTEAGLRVSASSSNLNATYSEDCLFLNVWTRPQTGEAKKAVLLWIYGGGFSSGSSTIPIYNGGNLADEQDVVVVTFNYRLSILGFPGNPDGPANLALLDQRLAVEWVRDNIENFGGDASRITIFGQSAGGASVDLYSYAWEKDPIAAGFIPESGNAYSWGLPNSKATASSGWYAVSSALGCGNATNATSSAILSCVKSKPYADVIAAIPPSSGTAGILGLFGPTVDDVVVFSNYTLRTPAKVPMLIGNNNYEAGLFRTQFALDGLFLPDKFWNVFNLQEFTCPAGLRANASIAAKNPTWRYRYFGVFANLVISAQAGTYHAAEIPMLFNTSPNTPQPTEEQISIGKYMRGAWATFAKDPVKGLTTYGTGWPVYDPAKPTLVQLAYNNITGTNLVSPYTWDFYCPLTNVSSTDPSLFVNFPDFDPGVPPTPIPGNETASGTPTPGTTPTGAGTAPTTSQTQGSGAGRTGVVAWVLAAALLVVFI